MIVPLTLLSYIADRPGQLNSLYWYIIRKSRNTPRC